MVAWQNSQHKCNFDNGPTLAAERRQSIIHRFAVVGGGPAGLSFCLQLFEKLKTPTNLDGGRRHIELWLFERSPQVGPGLAYGRHSEHAEVHALNIPKDGMSPYAGRYGEFSEWLRANKESQVNSTEFPSRHHFGDYLLSLAERLQCEAAAHPFIELNVLTQSSVHQIWRHDDGGYCMQYGDINEKSFQNVLSVDRVVLCVGHLSSDTYRNFIGCPRYGHDTQSCAAILDSLKGNESIGIVGTKLSAYDVVLELRSRGHRGPIWMGSRTGLLSAVFSPLQIVQITHNKDNNRTTPKLHTSMYTTLDVNKMGKILKLKYLATSSQTPKKSKNIAICSMPQLSPSSPVDAAGLFAISLTAKADTEQHEFVAKQHQQQLKCCHLTNTTNPIPLYELRYLPAILSRERPSREAFTAEQLVWMFCHELGLEQKFACPREVLAHFLDQNPLDWLSKELEQHRHFPIRNWHLALFSLYPIVPELWRQLAPSEKRQFNRKWKSLFSTFYTAICPEVAMQIRDSMSSGQLRVISELDQIHRDEHTGAFIMHGKTNNTVLDKKEAVEVSVEVLINATGPGTVASTLPLVADLIASGQAMVHPFGGICVDENTLRVVPSSIEKNESLGELYAIGELTKGHFLVTASMTKVAEQANKVASQIAQDLLAMDTTARNNG